MKKIFLLSSLITLGLAGCSLDPTKPIDFPPVDTMYAVYDGPQLLVSKAEFVSALPMILDAKKLSLTEDDITIFIEERAETPQITLANNSNAVLEKYLRETRRFVMGSVPLSNNAVSKNGVKTNVATPITIEGSLAQLQSKVHGDTHVAKVFGEKTTITKTAVINLVAKDKFGNVLYIAEGKSVVNSDDKGVPAEEYLDDYTVNNALKNAIHDLSRAMDQGRIISK